MEDEASTSLDGKFLGNLRVVDLKHELEKRGLSKSGSKKDLVKRLKQQLEFEKLCEERKSSGDLVRKLELDAEIEQNEFVKQYLAQQQKRYAEREEKRLELEAMQKQEKETSAIDDDSQEKAEQISSSDSDEINSEKDTVKNKPSNNEPQNEIIEDLKLQTPKSVTRNESNSSASERDNEQSCPSTPVSESISVEEGNFKSHIQSETESYQNISQSSIDVDSKEASQTTFALKSELNKIEEKSSLSSETISENKESKDFSPVHYISDNTKEQNNSKSDNLDKCPNEMKNLDVSVHVSKDENDNETSSSIIYSSDTKIDAKGVELQSEASSTFKEVERNIDSSYASPEVASSPEHQIAENMETSECSSVPYSLSDIKLPESPGQVLKCKEVKKDEDSKIEPPSDVTGDESPRLDNTHSNGNAAPDVMNSSREEVVSDSETKDSRYSNDSPEKSNQRNDVKENRQSDESSDVESDRNDSEHKKKSLSYEDTSSNKAADSDESPSKEIISKRQKSRQQSDESDNEKSSDSEKYNHHSDSKRKSHDKHRKRNRHSQSRSRSSSTSSSHSSDSSPKRRHSKKSVVSKAEDFNEIRESNQMSDKNLDEKSKGIRKDNSALDSNLVSSVSSKKRLKIKRDNVPVEITVSRESSKNSASSKSIEKKSPHSVLESSSKQESTDKKEIIPEVPYTCRKLNLSKNKLNRMSSEEKSNEPKIKKSKWDSFAACQKTSSTISISTDSLKNWFPDFKLISEVSSSIELETDEQSSSAVDEKSISIVHTDISDGNDVVRRESTSHVDIDDSESMEPNYEDAPEQGPVSKIIFIQNLVRPFTLNQLKELLKQNGKIVEEYFWIDKIKSKCFVMYETEKEANRARNALNNTRWPSSNPKILSVEFSNEEEMEQHKKGNEPPPPKPVVEHPVVEMPENIIETRITHPVEEHKRKDRERRKERERSKHQAPVREWDKDKVMQDSPEREHIPKEEKSRSSEKKEKKESKKRPSEDTPAKLLDDLFQKTKNPPCIYWLPLTEEQAKQKEEAQKIRKLEREKRNQQLKEEADRRNRRARSSRRSREKENRKSSTRSRSPVSRRR